MIAETEGFPQGIKSTPQNPTSEDPRVIRALEEYLSAVDGGQPPARSEFLQKYPDLAGELELALEGLEFIQKAGQKLTDAPAAALDDWWRAQPLGDFRILREIGRGGMGVVYEAEQVSLSRRVALKVLPFAATMDSKQLQRFKNEAHAAANLHHQNIVPVYAVGVERDVHYYAMQFIDGKTLAAVIEDLREQPKTRTAPATGETQAYSQEAVVPRTADTTAVGAGPIDDTKASAPSVLTAPRSAEIFRNIARLGVQAALALEHAHQMGVIHRDIKPANILVDGRANLWITDFGLAQIQTDNRLTMTGDLIGTLRYMSPEQALAKPVGLDHRTDVYSLGATLYELLTLEPAFGGQDRQELLRQIAFEEPRPPRKINKAVPVDLETIALKAMAKNLAERYSTAQEVADDLERYLRDEPIRARRPTLVQRSRKWARRHRPVVTTALLGLLAFVVLLGVGLGWIVRDHEAAVQARQTRQTILTEKVEFALNDCEELAQAALRLVDENPYRWQAALAAAISVCKRAEALIDTEPDLIPAALGDRLALVKTRLEGDERDRQFLADIHKVRMEMTEVDVAKSQFRTADAYSKIKALFQRHRIEYPSTSPAEVRAWLQTRQGSIQNHIVSALELWLGRTEAKDEQAWLVAVLDEVDANAWRKEARRALASRKPQAVQEVLGKLNVTDHAPAHLIALAHRVPRNLESTRLDFLRQIQAASPGDFWANTDLGLALTATKPPQHTEAVRYLTAAVALQPQNAGAALNLAKAFSDTGNHQAAIDVLRPAVRRSPDYLAARINLGNAFFNARRHDEAAEQYRYALKLDSSSERSSSPYNGLANVLLNQGKVDEAIEIYRLATKTDPKNAIAHRNLGLALERQGSIDEALTAFLRSAKEGAKDASTHRKLGELFLIKKDHDQAIKAFRDATALNNKDVASYQKLAELLRQKQDFPAEIEAWSRAIAADPKRSSSYLSLATASINAKKYDEAIVACRKAIGLDPTSAQAHLHLSWPLRLQGKHALAEAACRQAIELRPDYAHAHSELGIITFLRKNYTDAASAYEKALQLDPKLTSAYSGLGDVFSAKQDLKRAIAAYRKANALAPKDFSIGTRLAKALRKDGDEAAAKEVVRITIAHVPRNSGAYTALSNGLRDGFLEEAIVLAKKAACLDSTNPDAHLALGDALRDKGDFKGGSVAFRKVAELRPADAFNWYRSAIACLAAGDREAHRQVCAEMLVRCKTNSAPYWADRTLYACVPIADAVEDLKELLPLAERALPSQRGNARILGAVLYRNGDAKQAIDKFNAAAKMVGPRAWDHFFVAMAYHRLGNSEKAGFHLTAGINHLESGRYPWNERTESEVLRREAEAVINGKTESK